MSIVEANILQWVKSEIDETLKQAQTSLEAYVEDTADESQMRFCINYLHQVYGTLQMVELHGAALAVEEMEKLAQAIFDNNVNNKDDAYEALMRSILQIPDYLEYLLAGNPDMPVVLLPLLNDIRAARNEALLSEGALFTPDLSVDAPAVELTVGSGKAGDLSTLARKLRHNYHLGLLSWFQDKNPKAGLQKIADVITELTQAAESDEARRVFWVANGLVESLKDDGVGTNVAVKMLLGHVDRQIKKIIDDGALALDKAPPEELEKNLLYYVASSTTSGELTKDIKKAFNLKNIMPDTQAVEQARADLAAPNAALMETVSSVIIEDINKIKDSLDVFVRADNKDKSLLDDVCGSLAQMADTLAMLNLGIQREAVLKQATVISDMVSGKLAAEEKELMNVAAAMIAVENSLLEVSTVKAASSIGIDGNDTALAQTHVAEQQKLMQTVLDEAKVNLAKVKDALAEFSQDNEKRDQLKSIPALLEQIEGGLMILSLNDAANLLTLTNTYIRTKLIQETIPPSFDDMNNLADAISSLEYYMESLMGSWGQPEAILDIAKQSVQALGINDVVEVEDTAVESKANEEPLELIADLEPSFESDKAEDDKAEDIMKVTDDDLSPDDSSLELTDVISPSGNEEEVEKDTAVESGTNEEPLELIADLAPSFESDKAEDDKAEDILEVTDDGLSLGDLSLELTDVISPSGNEEVEDTVVESGTNEEPLELIADLAPSFESDKAEDDKAEDILEVADDDLSLGDLSLELTDVISPSGNDENEIIPDAITLDGLSLDDDLSDKGLDFEVENDASVEKNLIEDKLEPVTDTLDDSVQTPSPKPDSTKRPSLLDDTIDDEIVEIFMEEAEEAYETISEFLPVWVENTLDDEPLKEIRRAYHTLKGSGRLVGAVDLGEFAWAFENMLNRLLDNTIKVDSEIFELMERGKQVLPELFELFKANEKPGENILELMEHADVLGQGKSTNLNEPVSVETEIEINTESDESMGLFEPEEPAEPEEFTTEDLLPVNIDLVLLDIYRKEVATHVETLKQYIRSWNDGETAPQQSLLRALHTLTGSSRTTGVETLAAVCSSFEHYVQHLQDNEFTFPQNALAELDETILLIERSIECLDKPGATLPEHEKLLSRIEALAKDIGSSLEVSSIKIEDPVTDISPVDYDEELLEIFLEEGAEILDESDQIIHDWISNPKKHEFVEELQRQLHTLKGGARMAGIVELGDLGHSVESLLTAVVDGHIQPSKSMFNLVQRAQDHLVKMLERVQNKNPLTAATELINEVDAMLENRGAANELEITEDSIGSEIDISNIISLGRQEEQQTKEIVAEKNEPDVPVEGKSDRRKSGRVQTEQVRVRADLLDNLVNFAGEVSIYRSRLEQQTNNFRYNITEFDSTVNRLREQLRQFEIETEAQIEYRHEETLSIAQENFDPLEMDRFTTMQHLSRAMMESLGDLDSLRGILNNLTRESETLLLQQSRVNTDLQEGLMRTRMVPFSGQAARLRRIVRQTCSELGKHADLHLKGVDSELDRNVIERIISPIEHMLRNAVAHGIEKSKERKKLGKPEIGNIYFSISNEGSDILIKIKDDGAGINLDAIRTKAVAKGLIKNKKAANKEKLLEMIMQSGFSTAESVSQIAGRGVGLDIVGTEIKQLSGIFNIDTAKNKGTTFTVSLPLTLTVSRALMVMVGDDTYAVPLLSVKGVERINARKIKKIMATEEQVYNWVGEDYKFMHLGTVMGINEMKLTNNQQLPMLMVRSGEYRAAILVDTLLGSREIVVKSVGPQLSTLRGISGATVMGDGSVVLIIDLAMLIRLAATTENIKAVPPVVIASEETEDTAPVVMVVDDSITVRKVTTRLLERHEMQVVTAKDGVDALAQLQESIPDIMLLDVEMPRMDGFELATNMRNDKRLKNIPIIMITSRTGQKHRDRAASIGVNIYMGKPFTETDLLDNINLLTG